MGSTSGQPTEGDWAIYHNKETGLYHVVSESRFRRDGVYTGPGYTTDRAADAALNAKK